MESPVLKSALHYHSEGANVIPIVYRDKKPALPTWEEYHTRRSTPAEIKGWFGNGKQFNLGIVHGAVSDNYVSIDLDNDLGIFEAIGVVFPEMIKGRIEQSGSLKGYHIPLRLKALPDFGHDSKQNRPRGNKTWKTMIGVVNIRAQFCQTLSPPSLHPSGNRYRFAQKGPVTQLDNLNSFIEWLDLLAPPKREEAPAPRPRAARPANSGSLIAQVLEAWPTATEVFREFGKVHEIQKEPRGGIRLLGNGGLILTEDEKAWYCFSDEIGGGIIAAWAYCRFGHYDETKHLDQCLIEMAQAGGIDLAPHQPQDQPTEPPKRIWREQYGGVWTKLRAAA
jgi:hypothetical protein